MHSFNTRSLVTTSKFAPVSGTSGATIQDNRSMSHQASIGNGGLLLRGRIVRGPNSEKYEIIHHFEFNGKINYRLATVEEGDEITVLEDDPRYQLDKGYTGVMGMTGFREEKQKEKEEEEEEYTPIEFHVARRAQKGRTVTTFKDTPKAIRVLQTECNLSKQDAEGLVDRKDWTYPMLRHLMTVLSQNGQLQPGLQEGVRLWEAAQSGIKKLRIAERQYTIRTTRNGSPLAQIVGCHYMEYLETNFASQGPRVSKDPTRMKEQQFLKAMLEMPEDQVNIHVAGIGQPHFVGLYPAPMDIRYVDNTQQVHSDGAGAKIYKTYQEAQKKRKAGFGYQHTLDNLNRKDRKTALHDTVKSQHFNVDQLEKFHGQGEDFLQKQIGIRETESDNSVEEVSDWESPLDEQEILSWTLKEFAEFVFKHNVYSGVYVKEANAKMAELAILTNATPNPKTQKKITRSRKRRQGVQSRVQTANQALYSIMGRLGTSTTDMCRKLDQWKDKSSLLASLTPESKEGIRIKAEWEADLKAYYGQTISELKRQGYPPPLEKIAEKTIKACVV